MSQSLVVNYVHLVFSTRLREPWMNGEALNELHRYISGVVRAVDCHPVMVGGVEDPVHILFRMSKKQTLVRVIEEVKKRSSKWMKQHKEIFQWQSVYASFSVSFSNVPQVSRYIRNQKVHHSKYGDQDELRYLLKKNQVQYDERYLWE